MTFGRLWGLGRGLGLRVITLGMGKSLTFQLPAVVASSGVTVVISPLLSIMVCGLKTRVLGK